MGTNIIGTATISVGLFPLFSNTLFRNSIIASDPQGQPARPFRTDCRNLVAEFVLLVLLALADAFGLRLVDGRIKTSDVLNLADDTTN